MPFQNKPLHFIEHLIIFHENYLFTLSMLYCHTWDHFFCEPNLVMPSSLQYVKIRRIYSDYPLEITLSVADVKQHKNTK